MTTEHNLYKCLSDAFNEAGYKTISDEQSFNFLPLNLKIEPEILDIKSFENEQYSCSVILTFSNPNKFENSITEYSMGIGNSEYNAIKSAFQRWIDCDFPPIHDYIGSGHSELGEKIESASYSGELNKYLGWDIYFGPLLESKEVNNTLETEINEKNSSLILQKLFQALTDDILGSPGTYFIRSFMSISSDNNIDTDCRLNGVDWSLGKQYLNEYINSLPKQNQIYFLKQSILLTSKPIEEIKSDTILKKLDGELAKMDNSTTKKWWKIWKK